jgi:hypothetical protein
MEVEGDFSQGGALHGRRRLSREGLMDWIVEKKIENVWERTAEAPNHATNPFSTMPRIPSRFFELETVRDRSCKCLPHRGPPPSQLCQAYSHTKNSPEYLARELH